MPRLAPTLALLLLAAAPAMAQVPAPNSYDRGLSRLDDFRRRAVLRRAVLDSAQYCDRVVYAGRQGNFRNLVMWTARCERGGDYGVFLGGDGSVQVRPCADLAALKLPTCRMPPRTAPVPARKAARPS